MRSIALRGFVSTSLSPTQQATGREGAHIHASLLHGVRDILFLCTEKQVIGIDARGSVTTMQDVHPRRDGSDEALVCGAMREFLPIARATAPDHTVPANEFRAGPHPTSARVEQDFVQ
jgi:hypothetical protein